MIVNGKVGHASTRGTIGKFGVARGRKPRGVPVVSSVHQSCPNHQHGRRWEQSLMEKVVVGGVTCQRWKCHGVNTLGGGRPVARQSQSRPTAQTAKYIDVHNTSRNY